MLLFLANNIIKADESQYSNSHLSHIKSAFVLFHKERKIQIPDETAINLTDFIKASKEKNSNYGI
jgi:hypothetical protein